MAGRLIFRGNSTENLAGVWVSKMPSPKRAAMRNTEYYVKGRDGALHVNEGYENFDLEVILVLLNTDVSSRYAVNEWATGSGKLVTSDDYDKAYVASVLEEVEWTRVKANSGFYDSARIVFNCQPYMVEAVDTVYVIDDEDSRNFNGQGTTEAYPLIRVVPSSTSCSFTVNYHTIELIGVTANTSVYLDSETGYVWTNLGAATMRGDFPTLSPGVVNNVTKVSGVSQIDVTARWRWL